MTRVRPIGPVETRFRAFVEGRVSRVDFLDLNIGFATDENGQTLIRRESCALALDSEGNIRTAIPYETIARLV